VLNTSVIRGSRLKGGDKRQYPTPRIVVKESFLQHQSILDDSRLGPAKNIPCILAMSIDFSRYAEG
jgi:hypothetical protein